MGRNEAHKRQIYQESLDMRRTKFNVNKDATKRTYDGITFASELEMNYYKDVLLPLIESGKVSNYELQRVYVLQPGFLKDGKKVLPITYKADFVLTYKDGREEVIDTKGYPDSVALMKRKMFWYTYPDINYNWMGYSKIDGGWQPYEYIKKQRALRKKEKKKMEKNDDKK